MTLYRDGCFEPLYVKYSGFLLKLSENTQKSPEVLDRINPCLRMILCYNIQVKVFALYGGLVMRNLFEYLENTGAVPFGPQANADYAVFCRLSYIPFAGIVPADEKGGYVSLADAAEQVIKLADTNGDGRKYHLPADAKLLGEVIRSKRYSELKLGHYVEIFNTARQEQFCAMTFLIPDGGCVVVYRGTDGSIIGWKEDFNMGFMDELPSQKDAVAYINDTPADAARKLYVCGHSKGGNLAMYASAFAEETVQQHIAAVKSLDGPGFRDGITGTEGFMRVLDRMESFIPQSSIVGMLLEHKERIHIIHSCAKGSKQHDIYSWDITGDDFTEDEGLTSTSLMVNKAINSWAEDMPEEKRMKLTSEDRLDLGEIRGNIRNSTGNRGGNVGRTV